MFSDNVNYTVSESQHTGPANQSEPDSLGGDSLNQELNRPFWREQEQRCYLCIIKLKYVKIIYFETNHEYMFHCTP